MIDGPATLARAREGMKDLSVNATRAAHAVEDQTAKIPSDTFLVAAIASVGVSLLCELTGQKRAATFIGMLAPTFIAFGLYNKIARAQRDMDY